MATTESSTAGWTTVFYDGFDGTSLDRSKWPNVYDGALYWNGAFYWDADQVSVSNGSLKIGIEARGDGLWNAGAVAGLDQGDRGFDFTYGRVEIRAKASQEVWGAGPCFLLWPASDDHWPPEVDILETPKGQGMFTNHWQGPGGNNDDRYASHFFDLDYSQWHTYTLDWLPDRLTLYVDGVEVYTFTDNIPHEAMSIALQGHVGTANDGWYLSPNGRGVDRVEIAVDYVKVSQWSGSGTPTAPGQTTPTPPTTPTTPTTPATPAGPKTLTGTSGSDVLAGGDAADTLSGAAGADTLSGGKGDDRLAGGKGYDVVTLGDGADTLVFAKGDGEDYVVDFKPGTDKIELSGLAKSEVTIVSYGNGTDILMPNGDKIWLAGVTALGANDIVYKNVPATTPPAPPPAALPTTPAAGKVLTGTSGSDTLMGGDGADTLSGGAGADTLAGGKGDDRLQGGAGYDVLTLGEGKDILLFAKGDGEDYIVDFQPGTDQIQLTGFAKADVTIKSWASGTDLLFASGEKLWLAGVTALGANDILYTSTPTTPTTPPAGKALTGTAGADTLTGTTGPDTLKGAAGNDLLQGGAGNDQLAGGKGSDTLTLGTGRDTVTYTRGDGTDRLTDFTAGEDKLSLSGLTPAEVSLRATAEGLRLDLADGGKILLAGTTAVKAGDITIGTTALPALSTTLPPTSKTVTGTAGHDNGLKGTSGADLILGGLGSDDLHGLGGNDILRGGKDHDGLTLGTGNDIVAFARGDGPDWVVDFTPGEDRLWLEGITPASLTQTIEQRWEYTGLALNLGQGDEIFLQGVTTQLTTADILFA